MPDGSTQESIGVLFLCTGNSCRSQMAEGFARAMWSDRIRAYSAGTKPQGLNSLAVRVMLEVGIDLSEHRPKRPEEIDGRVDVVIAVCDDAHHACPVLPAKYTLRAPFDDPPRLTRHIANEKDALPVYRRVRDDIRAYVAALPQLLDNALKTRKDIA